MFRISMEEGNLTVGKNGGAEHKGRETRGQLLHNVQRASTRDVAVRRLRRGRLFGSLVLPRRGASP